MQLCNLKVILKHYLLLACLGFIFGAPPGFAQDTQLPSQVLTLAVHDRQGQFINNIQREQILVKGVSATVRHMELDTAPRRILLLLDTSGSVGDTKTFSWSNIVQFGLRFVSQRSGDDSIGLDTLAEKDEVRIPFTTDSQSLVKQIEVLTSLGKGRTMLGVALTEILSRKNEGLRFGDTIVLVSDGDRSDADKTNFAHLQQRLIRAGIRLCLVRVPGVMPRGATAESSNVSGIVKGTGGAEFDLTDIRQEFQLMKGARVAPERLTSAAQYAYRFAQTYYRLDLDFSEPLTGPRQLQLEIGDQKKEELKGLRLNYPRVLLPPSTD